DRPGGREECRAAGRRDPFQPAARAPCEVASVPRRPDREGHERHTAVILPGAVIGVLGGGQLGRMFAIAARRMGYRVHTLSPDADTPTGQVADVEIIAPYEDLDAVRKFSAGVSGGNSHSRTW